MIYEFLISLLFSYTILCIGYGGIQLMRLINGLRPPEDTFWPALLLGQFFIGILALNINFFAGVHNYASYLILLALLFIGIPNLLKEKLSTHVVFVMAIMLLIPFTLSLKPGYDGGLYHLPYQLWLREEKIVFGLANFHGRFGFSSLQDYYQSLLWLKNDLRLLNHSTTIYFIAFFMFLWNWIFSKESYKIISVTLLILSLFLCNSFILKLSTYTDNSSGILYAITFLFGFEILVKSKHNGSVNHGDIFLISILALFSLMIKISSGTIMFWLLYIYIRLISLKIISLTKLIQVNSFIIIIVFIWLIKNVIISGCLVYPISFSCLNVMWSAGTNATIDSNWITAWARHPRTGFYSLESWKWFNEWWIDQYTPFLRDFFVAITATFSLSFLITIFRKLKFEFDKIKFVGIIFLLVSLALWFIKAPNPRFGVGLFLVVPTFIGLVLVNNSIMEFKNIKVVRYMVGVGLIALFGFLANWKLTHFNIDNLSRNYEIHLPAPEIVEDFSYGVRPVVRNQCWLVPYCSPYDRNRPEEHFGFKFFRPHISNKPGMSGY